MVPKVVVTLINELKGILPIGEICHHLGVGRSSYYRWKANMDKETKKDRRDQQIGELCKKHRYRYGYRSIYILCT